MTELPRYSEANGWAVGDRFRVRFSGNCDVDQPRPSAIVFELARRAPRRHWPKGGWMFLAIGLDTKVDRWMSDADFDRDTASGRIERVTR